LIEFLPTKIDSSNVPESLSLEKVHEFPAAAGKIQANRIATGG
jgi:hypothetical protein